VQIHDLSRDVRSELPFLHAVTEVVNNHRVLVKRMFYVIHRLRRCMNQLREYGKLVLVVTYVCGLLTSSIIYVSGLLIISTMLSGVLLFTYTIYVGVLLSCIPLLYAHGALKLARFVMFTPCCFWESHRHLQTLPTTEEFSIAKLIHEQELPKEILCIICDYMAIKNPREVVYFKNLCSTSKLIQEWDFFSVYSKDVYNMNT